MSEQQQSGAEKWEAFCKLVGQALLKLDDCLELDEFPKLTHMPAIESWAQAHPREWLVRGKRLSALLKQSVNDVMRECAQTQTVITRRVGVYVQARFVEHKKLKQVAQQIGISDDQVGRSVAGRAVHLVAKRFYLLAMVRDDLQQAS